MNASHSRLDQIGSWPRWTGPPEVRYRAFTKDACKAISRSIEAIEKVHPELGLHLHKSINLSLKVSYSPDVVIDWLSKRRYGIAY
ncbi:hypothetical protein U8335_24395 [Roseiconus lacunae]|uniref:hypothetical protein n=1 Tax=Roseiconus lacunae TaxID=2605694 RepID=UPI00309166BC|nr:hypothetical protein U8335_24395 [Stieleria sp. HD01]